MSSHPTRAGTSDLRDRRAFLKGLGAIAAALPLSGAVGSAGAAAAPSASGSGPLWRRAAARGLLYGAGGMRLGDLTADATYRGRVAFESAMLTPGNEMKFGPLHPDGVDVFRFDDADAMAELAARYRMLLRGHALVWHNQVGAENEAAIRSSADSGRILTDHVATVAGRYAGRVHSWDVVNEAVDPQQGGPDGLRTQSVWYETLGPEYIELAFRAAREADPDALLAYNDFGLELGAAAAAKRDACLRLLERLVAAGAPVTTLGVQAHIGAAPQFPSQFDAQAYRSFLADAASLGLTIIVTEMDVNDSRIPGDVATRDRAVADIYGEYLATVLDEPAVIGVATWGLSDPYSWLQARHERDDGLPLRPLPLDERLRHKPAAHAMAQAFDAAPGRELTSPVPFRRPLPG